jgi:hypothetical protein
MSNLSQYRMSIALFSLGLLWVASEVVGDGDKPGPLDTATKSIVHRLKSADHGKVGQAPAPYELAVTEVDVADREPGPWDTAAASPGGLATDEAEPPAQAESETPDPSPGAPDVGIVHK